MNDDITASVDKSATTFTIFFLMRNRHKSLIRVNNNKILTISFTRFLFCVRPASNFNENQPEGRKISHFSRLVRWYLNHEQIVVYIRKVKGALDNFNPIPRFFFPKKLKFSHASD